MSQEEEREEPSALSDIIDANGGEIPELDELEARRRLEEAFAAAYAKPWQNACSYETHARRLRLANAVMSADLAAVRSCDAIYLLRGWESSRGAKKELAEALAHGLTVMQNPFPAIPQGSNNKGKQP